MLMHLASLMNAKSMLTASEMSHIPQNIFLSLDSQEEFAVWSSIFFVSLVIYLQENLPLFIIFDFYSILKYSLTDIKLYGIIFCF